MCIKIFGIQTIFQIYPVIDTYYPFRCAQYYSIIELKSFR